MNFKNWRLCFNREKLKNQNILPLWAKISTKFIKKNYLCIIFWKQIVLGLYEIYRNWKIEGDEQLCPLTYTKDLNSSNSIQILAYIYIYTYIRCAYMGPESNNSQMGHMGGSDLGRIKFTLGFNITICWCCYWQENIIFDPTNTSLLVN